MKTKEISIQHWEKIYKDFEDYSFFQTPIWLKVICQTFGLKPKIFFFETDKKKVVLPSYFEAEGAKAIFGPYSLKSLYDGTYGGLIADDKLSVEETKPILDSLKQNKKIESLIIYPNPLAEVAYPEEYQKDRFSAYIIELADNFDFIWEQIFSGKVRNQTRKAQNSGLELKTGNGPEEFEDFYKLYQLTCARWGQEVYYPEELFINLAKAQDKNIKIWQANYNSKPIASILLFYGQREIFYWAGALDKEYSSLCPNNLLLTEAIKDACEKRYEFFNMGASENLENVKKYKESFGAKEVEYHSIYIGAWGQ